jgi:hypothetical protein
MALTSGTHFGPYEILAPLGAGGMGEVYRARDTKLERDVAIKVLPAAVAQDPERLARFEREAKVLASLNHPNIAQIYGVEDSGDTRALVMELVAGSTLSVPQPLGTALNYAKQIAEALEAFSDRRNEDQLPGRREENGISLHGEVIKGGAPPDLRSGRMRGPERQAAHAPHYYIYPRRTESHHFPLMDGDSSLLVTIAVVLGAVAHPVPSLPRVFLRFGQRMPQLIARLVEILARLLIRLLQTFLQFPASFVQLYPRFVLRLAAFGFGPIRIPAVARRSSDQPDNDATDSDPPFHARLRIMTLPDPFSCRQTFA